MMCQRLISHKLFDHVVLVFIFLNCITIALERPTIQPSVSLLKCNQGHLHLIFADVMLTGCTIQHILSCFCFFFRSECSSVSPIMFSLWFLLLKWLWRYGTGFVSIYCIRSIHSTKPSYRCDMACVKGGGPRLLCREAQLSAEHLECSGWGAGLCLSHWHSGLSGLYWWKPNPWHPEGSSSAENSAAAEVSQWKVTMSLSEAQAINEIRYMVIAPVKEWTEG